MAWSDVVTGNLDVYELPQSEYDAMARAGTLDENALYLTRGGDVGWLRCKSTKVVTVDPEDWVENSTAGRLEALIPCDEITMDDTLLWAISDAQKGAYAWGACDPGAGSVLLYIDAVPEEALIFKLKIMEQTEG